MYSIESGLRIAATPARVLRALTTADDLRGWWTRDVAVDGGELTFRFARPSETTEVRFRVDRADPTGVEMTCVAQTNNPDWLGTRLTVHLAADGDGAKVALVHAGYPAKNELYEMCIKGWSYFLASLGAYLETGVGTPNEGGTRAIADGTEIAAPAAKVLAALTTQGGVRGWWTQDCEIGPREHTYRFRTDGPGASSTFRVDRQDDAGLALTCTSEQNGMGWVGTQLRFALAPRAGGTAVALTHAGFPREGGSYEQCIGGWRHFLASLKAYVETGTGTPHVPGVPIGKA